MQFIIKTKDYLFPHFLTIHLFICLDHHCKNLHRSLFIIFQPIHFPPLLIITFQYDYQIYYLNLCYFYHFNSLIQLKNYLKYFINQPKLLLATHQQKVALKKVKSCFDFKGIKFNFTNSCSITNFNLDHLLQVLIIVIHTNNP